MSFSGVNCEASRSCPSLAVSRKPLSQKPRLFSGYKFVKRSLDLSDSTSIVSWMKHLEKFGNPESLRLHYLFLLRNLIENNPSSDDVMRLNRQVVV